MSVALMKDYDEILIALRRLMRAADMHSQKLLREAGLTTPQLLVMQAIEKEGNPSTSVLARHIVVLPAQLAAQGLLGQLLVGFHQPAHIELQVPGAQGGGQLFSGGLGGGRGIFRALIHRQ